MMNQAGLKNQNTIERLPARVDAIWEGPMASLKEQNEEIKLLLSDLESPCFAIQNGNRIAFSPEGIATINPINPEGLPLLGFTLPFSVHLFGSAEFRHTYGLKYAYMSGAMANGIASENLVIELGRMGCLGSYGAAGLSIQRINEAIEKIKNALPSGPYAFNVIHSPNEPEAERRVVELYLREEVRVVEASAFLGLTANIVHYRLSGLGVGRDGKIQIKNRVIAKLSRKEVAAKFMDPAPPKFVAQLLAEGKISEIQAKLAEEVPMADDISVEADSGGHTDNRPLVSLLPSMLAMRDEVHQKYKYAQLIRVGAAGGIATPASALAAFMMGAAYIVTGSVNQACIEAGTSAHTRSLLAKAAMTDVTMAPAADMFEMGVRVQVLKSGTLFPMRASKLFEIYNRYESIDQIPQEEREKLEKQVFKRSLEEVWQDTMKFFRERDPDQIIRANANPKRKMALIFRWYLGLSSRWSNVGESGREMDYQIWCGPSMGAFNDWVRGTYLENPGSRTVTDVAHHLMRGAGYLSRIQALQNQGVKLPLECLSYIPEPN